MTSNLVWYQRTDDIASFAAICAAAVAKLNCAGIRANETPRLIFDLPVTDYKNFIKIFIFG